jgi:hypothetical protein
VSIDVAAAIFTGDHHREDQHQRRADKGYRQVRDLERELELLPWLVERGIPASAAACRSARRGTGRSVIAGSAPPREGCGRDGAQRRKRADERVSSAAVATGKIARRCGEMLSAKWRQPSNHFPARIPRVSTAMR